MQVSKQFLLEAAGLVLVVAFILIGVQIYQKFCETVHIIKDSQERQTNYMEEYEITRYEGYCLRGSVAISYAKEIYTSYQIPIRIKTSAGELLLKEELQFQKLRDPESEYYINPLTNFFCEIIRDSNHCISEIQLSHKDG